MHEWVVREPADLGDVIRSRRHEQGLVQAELAELAGIHRSYLSDLERGHATEHTERLFRILWRLGLEVVVRPRGEG